MVIDAGWEGVEEQIIGDGNEARTVGAYCFLRANVTDTPLGTSMEPGSCENNNTAEERLQSHGTEVALALLEVAPSVELYVSNAKDGREVSQVAAWLAPEGADRRVDIIVHSIDLGWEGPGDGTATANHPYAHPIVKSIRSATAHGILWVSPTGNHGEKTWFSRTLTFNKDHKLNMSTTQVELAGTCAPLAESGGLSELNFVLRWGDTRNKSQPIRYRKRGRDDTARQCRRERTDVSIERGFL